MSTTSDWEISRGVTLVNSNNKFDLHFGWSSILSFPDLLSCMYALMLVVLTGAITIFLPLAGLSVFFAALEGLLPLPTINSSQTGVWNSQKIEVYEELLYPLFLQNVIHLFTDCEWNSSFIHSTWGRNYSPRACPREIVSVEGWIKDLFHTQPVDKCFIILMSLLWIYYNHRSTAFFTMLWNVELFSVTDALITLNIHSTNQIEGTTKWVMK